MPSELSTGTTARRRARSQEEQTRPTSLVLRTIFHKHYRNLSLGVRKSREKQSTCDGVIESKAKDDAEEEAFDALCRRCSNLNFGKYLEGDKTSSYSVQWWRLEDMQAPSCQLCAFGRNKVRDLDYEDVCHYMPSRKRTGASLATLSANISHVERFVYFQPELNILPPYDLGMHAVTHTFTPVAPEAVVARGSLRHAASADLGLARHWVKFCREKHGNTCGTMSPGIPFGLKVIDCSNNQICAAPLNCRYIALSYLWGKRSTDMSPPPSGLGSIVPRTIADAILVAKRLEIPFLWVDRYCIDQNNEAEKHNMIANMDKIYLGAALTIIAAAGSGPQHGLPGVLYTARNGITWKSSECGSFTSMPRVRTEIEMSTWASRGWTYQEMLLSPRRLIFTQSQIYFHCCNQEFREAFSLPSSYLNTPCANDTEPTLPSATQLGSFIPHYGHELRTHVFPKNGIGSCATDIYKRIREYSFRQLSYPTDRLNAFDGVFNAFRRSMPAYIHHFWGVPILDRRHEPRKFRLDMNDGMLSSFLIGMAWELVRMGEGRSDLPPNSREKDWPSWSWSSVSDRKLSDKFGLPLKFQKGIAVMLTHRNGGSESMWTYASQQSDYREYQPWIDLTTWILEDVELEYSKAELQYSKNEVHLSVNIAHPSIKRSASKDFTIYADIDGEKLDGDIIAIYIGTQEMQLYDASRQHYIFATKNPDGTYRRIGYGTLAVGPAASKRHNRYNKSDQLTWLPGLELTKSLNDWTHKCVRLV